MVFVWYLYEKGEILTDYEFRDCGKLQRLPEGLTKLKRLQIRDCPVAAQGHPPEPSARISDRALSVRQISAQGRPDKFTMEIRSF